MTIYATILTIIVLGYIVFKVYRYFNNKPKHNINEALAIIDEQNHIINKYKKQYGDLLNETVDTDSVINGGKPISKGSKRVNAIDDL